MWRTGTRRGVPIHRTPTHRERPFGGRPRYEDGSYRTISVTEPLFDRQRVADISNGAL